MKILEIIKLTLCLLPPIGLLVYAFSVGAIDSFREVFINLIRFFLVAFVAMAIGAGIIEKVRFIPKEGIAAYFFFYLIYTVFFFALNFLFGFEIMYSDLHEPWYHI